MKAQVAIHVFVPQGAPQVLRTADPLSDVLDRLDALPQGGTLKFNLLTGAGKVKNCFIPAPTVLRIEEL